MPLKILVPVKRVIHHTVSVRVKADHSGVETENVNMGINPFDEIAVEEAMRLKEAAIAEEIIVVSIGSSACQETLRTALAMGADRAILMQTEETLQPLAIAKLLQYVVQQENPGLVLMGKQAIDDDCNQTGQMLAGLLDWPQATCASKISIENTSAVVTREVDAGLETLRLTLPAVITTDLRLNTPRYLSLPNIMKSKQKKMDILIAADLGINLTAGLTLLKLESPPARKAGVMLDSVTALRDILKRDTLL
jgi:electron transfer flavoprotein beta subunit